MPQDIWSQQETLLLLEGLDGFFCCTPVNPHPFIHVPQGIWSQQETLPLLEGLDV